MTRPWFVLLSLLAILAIGLGWFRFCAVTDANPRTPALEQPVPALLLSLDVPTQELCDRLAMPTKPPRRLL